MDTISKRKRTMGGLFRSSQMRYALAYVLITTVALCVLNIQLTTTTRSMLYQSKNTAMTTKSQLVATALSGVESLSTEHVEQVVTLLQEVDVTRILVTDNAGIAIYDSLSYGNAEGKALLLGEINQALMGNDVFIAIYENSVLESRMCIPVYNGQKMTGAVYLQESDTEQGAIINALERSIMQTTWILGSVVLMFSVIFSITFTRRMRAIMESVERLGEGAYNHKIALKGHDEVGILAQEFNKLTERLQEMEAAQRRFVSDASHELKTPLASIKLLSDSILQNQMDMETTREFVEDIGNEADRLTRLAQKLLELNRGETPRADLMVIEAGSVVERVIRMLNTTASLKNLQVESQLEMGCTVVTHEDDFYQVAFNLVENAMKYNEMGGKVMVSLWREDEDVILEVGDTGMGIPADAVEHVFERFYRVDKARSRQAGGNGLGLSIVREMVERNYGTVSVESEIDVGTRFTVKIPYFGLEEELG
ncbi:MAG: HAMP domain-containing sensor histidine kinase [Eubacteriales bacterium]